MAKIVFDVENCLECPCCEDQEAVYGIAFLSHISIKVCPECEGESTHGLYGPKVLEQLSGRCVEDDEGHVTGVPDWCPRLLKS